jgi:hypothetical protein
MGNLRGGETFVTFVVIPTLFSIVFQMTCYFFSSVLWIPLVRLYDAVARIAMIRTPMVCSDMVRSSLTFMTLLKGMQVVTCVVSVNRSIRTAKIATIRHLCKNIHLQHKHQSKNSGTKKKVRNKSDLLSSDHSVGNTHYVQRLNMVRDL